MWGNKKFERARLWQSEIYEVLNDKTRWRKKEDKDGRSVWMDTREIINYEKRIGIFDGPDLWN